MGTQTSLQDCSTLLLISQTTTLWGGLLLRESGCPKVIQRSSCGLQFRLELCTLVLGSLFPSDAINLLFCYTSFRCEWIVQSSRAVINNMSCQCQDQEEAFVRAVQCGWGPDYAVHLGAQGGGEAWGTRWGQLLTWRDAREDVTARWWKKLFDRTLQSWKLF